MINPKYKWIYFSLFWAAFMFLFNTILWPISQHEPITIKRLLIGAVIWTFGGFLVGWLSSRFDGTKKTNDRQA